MMRGMKPHDCAGLNDAQCLHADHFFARFEHWRGRGFGDEKRFRVARGDAQAKYPLDDSERAVMDEYLRERVEVRMNPELKHERRGELVSVARVVT